MQNQGLTFAGRQTPFRTVLGLNGLAREGFIISGTIQVHPLALVHFAKLPEGPAKEQIAWLTRHSPHKPDYLVDRLAEGVGRITAAFYPKDVIVRLSDFKINEYAGLLGGEQFEPKDFETKPREDFRKCLSLQKI